ncbi:MAG: hypothetical protein JW884_01165 [Deltaproteobacteria bacterium]|nr:hypothetical protein [Deltaproteobacteria bacterium]
MDSNILGFFQQRMATAYAEQAWAVALISGMNVFVAANTGKLLNGFKRWTLVTAVSIISFFAVGFVWSRHFIFMHYDTCLKGALAAASPGSVCSPENVTPLCAFFAIWSGVALYTLIITGLWAIAFRILVVERSKGSEDVL